MLFYVEISIMIRLVILGGRIGQIILKQNGYFGIIAVSVLEAEPV